MSSAVTEILESRVLLATHPLSDLPALSSRPGSAHNLALDFNGDNVARWSSWVPGVIPAYDSDGDKSTYSDKELDEIKQIWSIVADHFSPFGINVTTVDMGSPKASITAVMNIGGSSNDWLKETNVRGVSYIGDFFGSNGRAFIFSDDADEGLPHLAASVSHEAGHLFGLMHQRNPESVSAVYQEYSLGGLDPFSYRYVGPTMGYAGGKWWRTFRDGSVVQDDYSKLTNVLGSAADEISGSLTTGRILNTNNFQIADSGIVENPTDSDLFAFTASAGQAIFKLKVGTTGAASPEMRVLDAAGSVIASMNRYGVGGYLSEYWQSVLTVNLQAGNYFLEVRSNGTPLVNVSPKQEDRYYDIGHYSIEGMLPGSGASIQGTVFYDTNNNGLHNLDSYYNEYGVPNVTVWLDVDGDQVLDPGEMTTTSDVNGLYTFTNVPKAGSGANTRVRIVVPSGSVQTLPGSKNGYTVDLSPEFENVYKDFGIYTPPPSNTVVNGNVYNDYNKNGMRDNGEPGLAGISVWLDLDGDKVIDTGELTVATDSQGNYSFNNVPSTGSGTSTRVRAIIPAGSTQILPANNYGYPVDLTAGATNSQKDFAIYVPSVTPASATISGVVYDDANNDGLLGPAETKLPGRTVFIDANNDNALNAGEVSVLTDQNGTYQFGNLPSGTYKMMVVLGVNQHQTSPTGSINLIDGQIMVGISIGLNTQPTGLGASISGTVFNDLNSSGSRNSGEPGLPNITVYLDLDGDKIIDTGELVTTTDAIGNYSFSNIPITGSGTSTRVRAVMPSGQTQTLPANGYGYPVDLRAGMTNTQKDFGIKTGTVTPPTNKGSIAGFFFSDTNKNGTFDSGEAKQSGKTVFIDLDGDGVLDTNETKLVTDSSGAFKFTNLVAGTYKIRRVIPTGYKVTTPARNITIAAGQNTTGVTIGTAAV